MPKKHSMTRRGVKATGRIAGYLEDKVCLAQGRTYVFSSSIAQFAEIRIQPSQLGDRAIAIADLYALWRPKSIRFRSFSLGGAVNVLVGHLYPDAVTTAPTSMEEAVDLPAFKCGNGQFGAPQPDLLLEEEYWRSTGMTQWYTTTTIPTDNLLENAGVLIYGNENSTFTTNNFRGLIEWEFEFKSMVDPQVSLARLEARNKSETKVDEGYLCVKAEIGPSPGSTASASVTRYSNPNSGSTGPVSAFAKASATRGRFFKS